jgi:hypothetical protein
LNKPRSNRDARKAEGGIRQSFLLMAVIWLAIVPIQARQLLAPYSYPPLGKLPFVKGKIEQCKAGEATFSVVEVYCGARSLVGTTFYANYAMQASKTGIFDGSCLEGPLPKGELVVGCIRRASNGKYYLYDVPRGQEYGHYTGRELQNPAVAAKIAAIKATCSLKGAALRASLRNYAKSKVELVSTWALGALGALSEEDRLASSTHLNTIVESEPSMVSEDTAYFMSLWRNGKLTVHGQMVVDSSLLALEGSTWVNSSQRIMHYERICRSLSKSGEYRYVQENLSEGDFSDVDRGRLAKLLVVNMKLSAFARADAVKIYAASQKTAMQKQAARAFLLKRLQGEPSLIVHRASCIALVRTLQLSQLDLKELIKIEEPHMGDPIVKHCISEKKRK